MPERSASLARKSLLVTGASGFLGQYVVAYAVRQDYNVRAVFRRFPQQGRISWQNDSRVEIRKGDLRDRPTCLELVRGMDAVIHLAAAKGGTLEEQYTSTVYSTETLLEAMIEVGVCQLVATSSLSVYDYTSIKPHAVINEQSPLETCPNLRDAYAQIKLVQEERLKAFQSRQDAQVTILRPGMLYGRNHIWNARLGIRAPREIWMVIGGNAKIPLSYVENCAEAMVMAVDSPAAVGGILNIVDDDLPTQREYCRQVSRFAPSARRSFSINWPLVNTLASTLWKGNEVFFRGKIKLPGVLVPARLNARYKPFEYSNGLAKQALCWKPRYCLDEALARSFSNTDLLCVPESG